MVAFLEAQEYVALAHVRDSVDPEDDDSQRADAAAAAEAILLLDASAEARAASERCAADFILSRARLQPVPYLTKASVQTLRALSPPDPDDDLPWEQEQQLRAAWETVLHREVPVPWRFHCMDGDPTAGDFGDEPFGVWEGVHLEECFGGDDFTLSVGTFSLRGLKNGVEYYFRLAEEEGEETWEDEDGRVALKGTSGAHWYSGGPLARGRHQGCRELHVSVRDQSLALMVSAERVLHGPAVPPFRVDWAFRGPADGLERMWLPWADWADWRAWVEDDDARMPTLPGYSAPLLNLFPLPLS